MSEKSEKCIVIKNISNYFKMADMFSFYFMSASMDGGKFHSFYIKFHNMERHNYLSCMPP